MKYIYCLLFFTSSLLVKNGYSQKTFDSLEFNQNLTNNYQQMGLYPDSILQVTKSSMAELSKHNGYLKGQCLRIIGSCHYIKGDFENALLYFDESLKFFKTEKVISAKVLTLVGAINSRQGSTFLAEKSFNTALNLAYESKDAYTTGYVQQEIARHFFLNERYSEAIEIGKNSLDIFKTLENNEKSAYDVLNIIAISMLNTDSLNAKPFLDELLEAAIKIGKLHDISVANANLASYYSKIDSFAKSLELNLLSLSQLEQDNYATNLAPLFINIGFNYYKLEDNVKAEEYLRKGIKLAEENNFRTYAKTGYKNLIHVLEKEKRFEEARIAKINYLKVALSIEKKANSDQISKLLYESQVELEKSKNETLELKISQKENEIKLQKVYIFIISSISIIAIILAFAFIKNAKKLKIKQLELQKTNERIKDLSHRKDQLISIVSHDLKEPLGQLIYMQEEVLNNQIEIVSYKNYMQKIYNNSINAMELLNNFIVWGKLYLTNHIDLKPVELQVLLKNVVQELEFQSVKKNIEISYPALELNFISEENILKSILRNLVSNAIKFSVPNSRVNIETVVLESNLHIYVSDTGVGFEESTKLQFENENENVLNSNLGTDKEKGNGIGLALSRDFAKKIGAKLYIKKSDNTGTVMALSIPIV